jgi:hypothetical protein
MPENSNSASRTCIEGYTRLLTQVASGRLDGLQCPECDQLSVSVCFTPHHANEYRSWFICTSCDFRSRTHNRTRTARPAIDRVKLDIENRSPFNLPASIFKRNTGPRPT